MSPWQKDTHRLLPVAIGSLLICAGTQNTYALLRGLIG
jgi:hypothetical protein